MYDLGIIGKKAKEAAKILSTTTGEQRNAAISELANQLRTNKNIILDANRLDVETARTAGQRSSVLDRLYVDYERIEVSASFIESLVNQSDPLGVMEGATAANGMSVIKTNVPIGVVGVVYDIQPDITITAAALCIKSGNACILRGGQEAFATNRALITVMRKALLMSDMPPDGINMIEDTSQDTVTRLMRLNRYLDIIIPKGTAALVNHVLENSTVPVIRMGVANCHLYVDKDVNVDMAMEIISNSKLNKPTDAGSLECVLVHEEIAAKLLPRLKTVMDENQVELRGCDATRQLISNVRRAIPEDFECEYLDYILKVRTVKSIDEAIAHIDTYSGGYADGIITNNMEAAQLFTGEINSAAVFVNTSTRFIESGDIGGGPHLGISTQRFHPRGPVGLKELTCTKYIINGNGQIK